MSLALIVFAAAVVAYLLGSIPFSYLISRARGIDLRKVGSGNIGATNAYRYIGIKWGFWAYTLDITKALAAAAFLQWSWVALKGARGSSVEWLEVYWLLLYLMPILGNFFPVWLRFRGGKGIAVLAGMYLWLAPIPALTGMAIFAAISIWKQNAALASLVSIWSCALLVGLHQQLRAGFVSLWQEHHGTELFALSLLFAFLATLRHKENIRRMLSGSEKNFKKEASPPSNEDESL